MYKILDLSSGTYVEGITLYTEEDCNRIMSYLYYSNTMNKHFILSEETSVFFNVGFDLVRVDTNLYSIEYIPDN